MNISNQTSTQVLSRQSNTTLSTPTTEPTSVHTVQDTYTPEVVVGEPARARFSEFPKDQQDRLRSQLKQLDSADRLFLQPKPDSKLVKANASDVLHAVDDGLGLAWIMEKTSTREKGQLKREEVSLKPYIESFERQHRIEGHIGYSGSPVLSWSDLEFVDYSSKGLPGVTRVSNGRDGSVMNRLDKAEHAKTKTTDFFQQRGPNYIDTFVHTEVKESKTWERWNLSEG